VQKEEDDMKRRVLSAVIMTCLFAGLSLPVSAAPAVMEDGGIFDAAYYAEQNRDVSAVFGTDQTALYRHWLICGKQEGRQPYDPSYDIDSLLDLQPAVNVDYSTSLGKSMAWDPAFSAYSGTSTLPKGVAHIAWDKSGITEITLGTYAEKNPVTGYFFDPAAAPGRSYAVLKSFLYENGYRICKEESQQDTLSDLEINFAKEHGWLTDKEETAEGVQTVVRLEGFDWTNGIYDLEVKVPVLSDQGRRSDTPDPSTVDYSTDGTAFTDSGCDRSYVYQIRLSLHGAELHE
jgi:hypothetical protein